jgi:hypothetical protein
MAAIGVQVKVADAGEKSLPASLGSAQGSCRWLSRRDGGIDLSGAVQGQSSKWTIQALCRDAHHDHDYHVRKRHKGLVSPGKEDRIEQWLALPAQPPEPAQTLGLDWKSGSWLSAWESSLPPDQPRFFRVDSHDGRTLLLTGEKAPETVVANDDFRVHGGYDNAAEIARNLVACWPNPPEEIAERAGITLRELQWFISGKAELDQEERFDLESLLGIDFDERQGIYVGVGPYVLVAHDSRALEEVYEFISHGGDACPCEIIPSRGAADPSWRYVLIKAYGDPPSIVMAPRGEKITERLPSLLMNYDGIKRVAPAFYRDVVSTCARACRDPGTNIPETRAFGKRYENRWEDCFQEPAPPSY